MWTSLANDAGERRWRTAALRRLIFDRTSSGADLARLGYLMR
jgi:hypothetical protein